ncbi:MAG: hypothetical protein LAT62_05195 [Natronospirillum sp.]|uniref:hypothetical protein n=1 Tax=Natronospirillum sp. TaxID=2812955 RepID=UPI0025E03733|nr:hypothetical protein [Natronospirillum sp.]MCH8551311.1 hypothetical protein [Natronospirillum sp.]
MLGLLVAQCALATSPGVDLFLLDDYSMDPEAMGYRTVPPPPQITSVVSNRWEGERGDAVTDLSSRLRSRYLHPATESLVFRVDAEARVLYPTRFDAITDDRLRFEGRIHEAALRHDRGRFETDAGWQALRWGAIPGAGVLDVISPQALSADADIQRQKAPQLSLRTAVEFADQSLSFFITPTPGFAPELADDPVLTPATDDLSPEFGAQLQWQGVRGTFFANAAMLVPDTATRSEAQATEADLTPYSLLGMGATLPVGPTEWKAELAYKSGLRPANPATIAEPAPVALGGTRDRLDGAVGVDFNSPVYGRWSGYLTLYWWLDDSDLSESQIWGSDMAVSWQESWLDQRLETTLTGYSSLTEPVLAGIVSGMWRFSPRMELETALTHYLADDGTPFADLDGETQFSTEWRYLF